MSFCVTGAAFGGRRSNWWSSSVTGRGRRNIWNVRLGYEEKRKSKSNIVCLCGLQWVCFSRIGHLTLNVSSGRMSLWTAATKKRENLKAILYVFADCNECVFSRIGHLTLNVSSGRMSLWTAATKKRENLKAILYVFADCNDFRCFEGIQQSR